MSPKEIKRKLYMDKVLHFTVLAFVSFLTGRTYGITIAVLVGVTISIAKEVYDQFFKDDHIDAGDLAADAIGIVFGISLLSFMA